MKEANKKKFNSKLKINKNKLLFFSLLLPTVALPSLIISCSNTNSNSNLEKLNEKLKSFLSLKRDDLIIYSQSNDQTINEKINLFKVLNKDFSTLQQAFASFNIKDEIIKQKYPWLNEINPQTKTLRYQVSFSFNFNYSQDNFNNQWKVLISNNRKIINIPVSISLTDTLNNISSFVYHNNLIQLNIEDSLINSPLTLNTLNNAQKVISFDFDNENSNLQTTNKIKRSFMPIPNTYIDPLINGFWVFQNEYNNLFKKVTYGSKDLLENKSVLEAFRTTNALTISGNYNSLNLPNVSFNYLINSCSFSLENECFPIFNIKMELLLPEDIKLVGQNQYLLNYYFDYWYIDDSYTFKSPTKEDISNKKSDFSNLLNKFVITPANNNLNLFMPTFNSNLDWLQNQTLDNLKNYFTNNIYFNPPKSFIAQINPLEFANIDFKIISNLINSSSTNTNVLADIKVNATISKKQIFASTEYTKQYNFNDQNNNF